MSSSVPIPVCAPVATSAVARDAGRELYPGLRVVRTVAMLSILGYHVSWEPLFRISFGLTSLQVVMAALAGRRPRAEAIGPFARRRAKRLLVPWVVWCGVYAAFEVARALRSGEPALSRLDPAAWAIGPSFHLWFLPFAFVASLAVNRVQRGMQGQAGLRAVAALGLAGVALLLAADPLKRVLAPATPFDLWIDGAATVAFGLAIGRALSLPALEERRPAILLVGLLGLVPLLLGETVHPPSQLYERYGVAVLVACAGFVVPLTGGPVLALLASYNLGVYLVHMLAVRVVDHVPGSLELAPLPRTLLVYAACLAAVFALRRLRVPYVV